MNKSIFYTGVAMLFAPFILGLGATFVYWLLNSGINFLNTLMVFCGLAYFAVAIWLIVKGVKE